MTQKWRQMTSREIKKRKRDAEKEIEQIVKKYKRRFRLVSFSLYGRGVKTFNSNGFNLSFLRCPYKHSTLALPKNGNMTHEEIDARKIIYEQEIRSILSRLATETGLSVTDSYTTFFGRVHITLVFVDYKGKMFL